MASETLNRLVAIENRLVAIECTMGEVKTELAGTNARLDVVVIRLDHMIDVLRQMAVGRAEFDALERRVERLEGTR